MPNTSSLVGLLVVGFIILIWGGSLWWAGLGILMVSAALAVSGGDNEPQLLPVAMPTGAAAKPAKGEKPPAWARNLPGTDAEGNPLSTVEDLKFRPSVLADGFAGINPMASDKDIQYAPGQGVSVGPRQGTLTIDTGPIRFKDDLRFRLATMEGWDMVKDPYTNKDLLAWHFRTQKPVFQEKTRMLESTMDQLDGEYFDWMNELPWQKKDKK